MLSNIVNIDSFVEYIAVLIYTGRIDGVIDIANNCGVWRTLKKTDNKYQSGKWYFILYDMDSICNDIDSSDIDMISSLMKNKQFKEKFYSELRKLSKKEFEPKVVEDFININENYIKKYILNDYKRFYRTDKENSEKIFEDSINEVIPFFLNRPEILFKQSSEDFSS